ncbi:MAG: protein-S-isoprenylcysteine O-methyltransferase Ste14 [Burkholderiaceae bacterium]|jgi:protein-S-isoprenylcysteine O-methyltransferase Ste14
MSNPLTDAKQPEVSGQPGWMKVLDLLAGLPMIVLLGLFAWRHVIAYIDTGHVQYVLLCISELICALFFFTRSAPVNVSTDPLDWLFGIAGTFLPMLLIPATTALWPAARHLISLGTLLQIVAMLSLNRSLAIVAARRKIKTGGLYRFVRHPMYASYLLMYVGYVLSNTTLVNVGLVTLTVLFLFVRMVREEKLLSADVSYRDYMQQVRYRVIPFVI